MSKHYNWRATNVRKRINIEYINSYRIIRNQNTNHFIIYNYPYKFKKVENTS